MIVREKTAPCQKAGSAIRNVPVSIALHKGRKDI